MADQLNPQSADSENKAEIEQEGTVTLHEYFEQQRAAEIEELEEERQLEVQAEAVLGGSDDTECTYLSGYVKRQALYACATCARESGRVAGVCLACSLTCHDGHTQYELYTKRLFRCDCGNSRFKQKCKLISTKASENEANRYDENFEGLYCKCRRPYPDTEAEDDASMYQCCVCENWFHTAHLTFNRPMTIDRPVVRSLSEEQEELEMLEADAELTCNDCMQSLEFLEYYRYELSAATKVDNCRSNADGAVADQSLSETKSVVASACAADAAGDTKPKAELEATSCRLAELKLKYENSIKMARTLHQNDSAMISETLTKQTNQVEPKDKDEGEPAAKCAKLEEAVKLEDNKGADLEAYYATRLGTAQIWMADWRTSLCKCAACSVMYERLRCAYLADSEDTLEFYETKKEREHEQAAAQSNDAGASSNPSSDADAVSVTPRKKVKDMTTAEYGEYRYDRFWDAVRTRVPRDAQNEMALAVREMKEAFNAWLATLPAGHVVTEAEARDFFAELRRRRDARREAALSASGVYN